MSGFITRASRKSILIAFGVLYGILALFAFLPPLYFWGSGKTQLILGCPVSVWYWLVNFILLLVVMFAFYKVEDIRGEADPDGDAAASIQ
ncbi:MAG: hypothetical protein PUF97_05115 [Bifidobacteriaceae bacterium]|nr:hypothetical protein [Bifidobacteriaceae bacterium]